MRVQINGNFLELKVGDITQDTADAIVNAANGSLMGGGGVDGAIHRAAGPGLLEECKKVRKEQLNGELLPTGKAVITQGYQLPAKFVIHTVGPVWYGGIKGEPLLLQDCYRHSLQLAENNGIKSITFPSISTGVYGYPVELAAGTALQAIVEFLREESFGTVAMMLFSENDFTRYQAALQKLMG
ncbi:O-acetyl-ADP-ribose deacetylase [Siminovitchia sediminis]|uniref:O-acetyl-ADP-ribose deacetylase n=1 Tax=Siminovitchia sediminis TaxID=1274353 RepID=A0ABW4KDW8_9BACI